jgi:hypothetical protein
MAPLNTTVNVSAAPAAASRLSVSHRLGDTAKPANAAAQRTGTAAEPLGVDRREKGDRQAEDSGVEIGEKRAGQYLAATNEADTLRYRAKPRPRCAALRTHRGQPGRCVQRRGEADRVDEIANPQTQVRHGRDEASECGAGGQHDLEAQPVQHQPGRQLASR